jgi:hypothetical protein
MIKLRRMRDGNVAHMVKQGIHVQFLLKSQGKRSFGRCRCHRLDHREANCEGMNWHRIRSTGRLL